MFTVADMMTPNPHTLSTHHTLSDANQLMERAEIRHIPIVDEQQQLCAILSQRDILAAQHSHLIESGDQRQLLQQTPLLKVAKMKYMSVNSQASLKEAALYMQQHRIGCLPVVDNDQLLGIITDTDFVAIAINLLEIQEENEPMKYDD
ncbi:CBS domain-containing protein [Thaumasiovibrio sp. DFM-14]|uniref:CBS domain-containing protein n=1 Tax=Thaumasiovibrio sp. DFM-14 TaxID=3384792 RepID=UPI00399FE408